MTKFEWYVLKLLCMIWWVVTGMTSAARYESHEEFVRKLEVLLDDPQVTKRSL